MTLEPPDWEAWENDISTESLRELEAVAARLCRRCGKEMKAVIMGARICGVCGWTA